MPELPEVEVLVRHLEPLLKNKVVRRVQIRRAKVLATTPAWKMKRILAGARFTGVSRRGKYLLFTLQTAKRRERVTLVGHLGMTGRMYLLPAAKPLPKHAAVVANLGRENFVFEDTRYFGKLTLDRSVVEKLGLEPLEAGFTAESFGQGLKRSGQPIKVKLLDQSLVAGVGNIYASEALFRAGISPKRLARRLTRAEVDRLWRAIREVLTEAIRCGSTVPLSFSGTGEQDKLFYFGQGPGTIDYYEERLRVYDRAGQACPECGSVIRRIIQAARSTFYCPRCQRR